MKPEQHKYLCMETDIPGGPSNIHVSPGLLHMGTCDTGHLIFKLHRHEAMVVLIVPLYIRVGIWKSAQPFPLFDFHVRALLYALQPLVTVG